ncbi:hypothetical protein CANCADRAFT_27583, partial [Tortispora caseinolytica NRRL Y-17796]
LKNWDLYIDEYFVPVEKSVARLNDPVVSEQFASIKAAFTAERKFLDIVSRSKKPTTEFFSKGIMDLLAPVSAAAGTVRSIQESHRNYPLFNLLSTFAEGIACLGWVTVEPTPAPFIEDMKESAQFYSNRVLTEFKETNPAAAECAKLYIALLTGLQKYVKAYHTTGVTWNPKGLDIEDTIAQASGASPAKPDATPTSTPAAAAAPPPPPPPPPADLFTSEPAKPAAGGLDAVFAELNKGEAVTAGLKKVDKSQMTHKNPALRGTSTTPATAPSAPTSTKPVPLKTPLVKRPSKTLDGTKWFIENFVDNHEITVDVEIHHGIFISNCCRCTIKVVGKCNAITISQSERVGLLVENLVSGVDIVKCKNFALQVTGTLPTVTVDQSNDGEIYLSESSLETEIYTSQCTAVNVYIPKGEGDYTELPAPEQIVHKVKNGALVSEIVRHSG